MFFKFFSFTFEETCRGDGRTICSGVDYQWMLKDRMRRGMMKFSSAGYVSDAEDGPWNSGCRRGRDVREAELHPSYSTSSHTILLCKPQITDLNAMLRRPVLLYFFFVIDHSFTLSSGHTGHFIKSPPHICYPFLHYYITFFLLSHELSFFR